MHFSQLLEGFRHFCVGLLTQRRVVQINLLKRSAPVIGTVVDAQDLKVGFQQLNRRQDTVTMHSARVQIVRFKVGGGHKTNAVFKQCGHEPVQNHGVGNVRDMKFIKTNQAIALGNTPSQLIERIGRALQLAQLKMHLAHELVKVQTGFTF